MTGDPSTPAATPETPEKPGGLRSDQFSGAMLTALALYLAWANRDYPLGTLSQPGPGYLPLALAIFLGTMGLLIALGGSRSARLRAMQWPEATRAVVIMLACAGATLLLERIGYRLTVIVLLVFLLGIVERKSPLATALVALGFGFGSFYVVGDLLHVPLPRSPWGF
jgi:putative tricarboxylic transport membrane protein